MCAIITFLENLFFYFGVYCSFWGVSTGNKSTVRTYKRYTSQSSLKPSPKPSRLWDKAEPLRHIYPRFSMFVLPICEFTHTLHTSCCMHMYLFVCMQTENRIHSSWFVCQPFFFIVMKPFLSSNFQLFWKVNKIATGEVVYLSQYVVTQGAVFFFFCIMCIIVLP